MGSECRVGNCILIVAVHPNLKLFMSAMPINWRCGYLFAPQLKNGEKLIHGVGLFLFLLLMGKVVFDSWERNGIKPKFNLDLFFSGF